MPVPLGERLPQLRGSDVGFAGPRPCDKHLEAQEVELFRCDFEPVPGRMGLDRLGAQDLAEGATWLCSDAFASRGGWPFHSSSRSSSTANDLVRAQQEEAE